MLSTGSWRSGNDWQRIEKHTHYDALPCRFILLFPFFALHLPPAIWYLFILFEWFIIIIIIITEISQMLAAVSKERGGFCSLFLLPWA